MNNTNTPKEIDNDVIDFCKSIASNSIPEYVPLRPELGCIINECYDNVEKKVKKCGGKRQLGWRIQVIPDPYPKYMIEAVHHAIWVSESNEKIDITPQPDSASSIVFLSDETTTLGKYRIGEKYQALMDCPLVKEYVKLCNLESTEYFSKTLLSRQPGIPQELTLKQHILLQQIAKKHFRS